MKLSLCKSNILSWKMSLVSLVIMWSPVEIIIFPSGGIYHIVALSTATSSLPFSELMPFLGMDTELLFLAWMSRDDGLTLLLTDDHNFPNPVSPAETSFRLP